MRVVDNYFIVHWFDLFQGDLEVSLHDVVIGILC